MQVLLGGIGLYGSDRSDFNVVAELVVEGSASSIIATTSASYSIESGAYPSENWAPVLFAEPVTLEPDITYAIIVKISSASGASRCVRC